MYTDEHCPCVSRAKEYDISMSNTIIGFMMGLGVATWAYSKIMRSSGGNAKNSLIVAASAGIAASIIMILVMNAIS